MTGVVRTMIEVRAAFHYLCTDACSQDEWYCRWNLFNLHDCVSRIRLFSAMGDSEQVAGFEAQADELRGRLASNPFFQSLPPKQHKKLLHGQTAYLSPLEVLMERAGMDVETFRYLYILFSTHVHALPMSFYRIGGDNGERGRGLPSSAEEGYSSLCLSLAASLIVQSRDELHALFDGLSPDPAYTAGMAERPQDEPEKEEMLAIGETASHDANEDIRIERTRESEAEVRVRYIHRQTGEAVFEGHVSEPEGMQFSYIDPYFWDIYLNGASTSRAAIERTVEGDFLLRVDIERRRILFKTRTGEEPS